MKPELTPLIGVFGVVVGTLVQYWLSKLSKRDAVRVEQKAAAYLEYMNHRFNHSKNDPEQTKKILASLPMVCLYAPSSVLSHLSELEKESGFHLKGSQKDHFIKMIQAMRNDCKSDLVTDDLLSCCLISKSTQSH